MRWETEKKVEGESARGVRRWRRRARWCGGSKDREKEKEGPRGFMGSVCRIMHQP